MERLCASQKITMAGEATQVLALPVEISAPGGGLLLLSIDTAGASYWLPLFTYVEDLPTVLAGIQGILADQPDTTAHKRLNDLQRCADLPAPSRALNGKPGITWRNLFEEASALRDALLLQRLNFERLLFVKRKPFYSEQPFMDAHHCYNRPGGGIYSLSPVRPDGQVTPVVDSLKNGIYRDLCLHWDAQRLLFAFGNGADRPNPLPGEPRPQVDPDQRYHLYEVKTAGTGLRQLTTGLKNDCEPIYLPNGQICFTSDRSEHFVMCGSNIHVANLHVMNADGSGIRQLSHNVFNEFQPSLLPDGRILYTRWEYNERSVTSVHNLFTIRPDGSQPETFFGNASIRPNVFMFGRPVPGSHKVTALFTGHHGQTHGPIGLIDPHRGQDGLGPIKVLTPGIPITAHSAEDSYHGWFSDPRPLSETTYLCSFTPTVLPWLENTWGLYVGDRHGNLALIQRDPKISLAEPLPLVRQTAPKNLAGVGGATPPLPPLTTGGAGGGTTGEAEMLVVDVNRGLGGVPRSTVKFIRILEDKPRKCVPEGGVIVTSGTSIYTTKRILGTVPVEPDGSAYFKVPADRNVYFQVLDDKQREIQRMRSVVCLKPGERRSCVGCHENPNLATPNKLGQAFLRPPSRPTPPPWGTQSFSFLRDLQPILDAKCVSCHSQDRKTNKVILTGDLTDQFSVGYQELLPYLSVANAMRFDNPEDVYARPPYTYGSKVSRLTQLLEKGHHGVQLNQDEWVRLATWIDTNAVYYDRYESIYLRRHIFTGETRKTADDLFRRRCVSCHTNQEAKNGGQQDSWWLSLNRGDVKQSRALLAPLARAAGGWGHCNPAVFATTADADYQLLLKTFTGLRDTLKQRPREDLLSLVSPYEER